MSLPLPRRLGWWAQVQIARGVWVALAVGAAVYLSVDAAEQAALAQGVRTLPELAWLELCTVPRVVRRLALVAAVWGAFEALARLHRTGEAGAVAACGGGPEVFAGGAMACGALAAAFIGVWITWIVPPAERARSPVDPRSPSTAAPWLLGPAGPDGESWLRCGPDGLRVLRWAPGPALPRPEPIDPDPCEDAESPETLNASTPWTFEPSSPIGVRGGGFRTARAWLRKVPEPMALSRSDLEAAAALRARRGQSTSAYRLEGWRRATLPWAVWGAVLLGAGLGFGPVHRWRVAGALAAFGAWVGDEVWFALGLTETLSPATATFGAVGWVWVAAAVAWRPLFVGCFSARPDVLPAREPDKPSLRA